jgi:ubiquinone/menaquinone biosynthesis C-methylase UbiE
MYGECPVVLLTVLHELPAEVTERVVAEAYRILKPGGALTIMEMDPLSPG